MMGRMLRRLIISQRSKSVRQSLIYLFTHLLLLAGVVFTFEIILILLGVGNIFLPVTHKAMGFISGLIF
jgi:hypothetical protein